MRFGLLRLLATVIVFGPVFVWTRPLGTIDGLVLGTLIAGPIAGIMLIARRSDIPRLVTSLAATGAGLGIGMLPDLLLPRVRPGYEAGDEYRHMIVGAFVGWLIGCMINSWRGNRGKMQVRTSDPHLAE